MPGPNKPPEKPLAGLQVAASPNHKEMLDLDGCPPAARGWGGNHARRRQDSEIRTGAGGARVQDSPGGHEAPTESQAMARSELDSNLCAAWVWAMARAIRFRTLPVFLSTPKWEGRRKSSERKSPRITGRSADAPIHHQRSHRRGPV
jgi:hypothetical protein